MVQYKMKNPAMVINEINHKINSHQADSLQKLLLKMFIEATVDERQKALPKMIGPSEIMVQ